MSAMKRYIENVQEELVAEFNKTSWIDTSKSPDEEYREFLEMKIAQLQMDRINTMVED